MSKIRTHVVDGEPVTIETGSGNVFADLGLPEPEERLLKANIAIEIANLVKAKGLTQAQTATLVGLSQPKISDILRGRLAGYSVERLLSVVNRLGRSVEVRIAAHDVPAVEARVHVMVERGRRPARAGSSARAGHPAIAKRSRPQAKVAAN